MIDSDRWWIGCDNDGRIDGLFDSRSNTHVNSATVTSTLYTASGVVVAGTENVSLAYEANSNGNYVGTSIPAATSLTEGLTYTLVITVKISGVQVGVFKVRRPAAYQGPQKRS